jgi:citrate synthase
MGTFTITNNETNQSFDFDILKSTKGPNVVDLRSFYAQTGYFTFDPGFTSTASCRSTVTYIDGNKGELRYRGHLIEDLALNHSYLDVCFLLLNGRLPNEDESTDFDLELRHRSFINEGLRNLYEAFPDNAHPMATMSSAVSALSAFYFDHLDITDEEQFQVMARRIIAKIPTIAAFSYRHSLGIPFIYPDVDRYFTQNFLYMLRAYPHGKLKKTKDGYEEIKPIEVQALDAIFTLHADHEQNASTTTVRNVASTGAHPYAAISAGISALWGRAHGGANESVIAQLELIGSVENVEKYIAKAKDKNDPFRLMGFGHRVYKNFDPRAKIEEIALNDEYFVQRKLYPNIDFYSGVILTALKIPKEMFTPIFVIGRTVGWITQWIELKKDKEQKIARPRQLYVGE